MTERNMGAFDRIQAQTWDHTMLRLSHVREAAKKDKTQTFTNLIHHITPALLTQSFYELKRQSARGVDEESWNDFHKALPHRVIELHARIKSGRYKPRPAKRVYIPKDDGTQRPISIQCVTDKVVQQAVVQILNQIYENDFLGFSYGFRPNKSQHHALDALYVGIRKRKVNWVLDLDIKKFFDTVDHDWLIEMVRHRVHDKSLVELIIKWIKVGYVEEQGKRCVAQRGIPQGSVISPLLANIYLHYAFDLWTHQWRKTQTQGDIIAVRYADDGVLGFQHRGDAERYLQQLTTRLANFGLTIHPEKTQLIQFGRFAEKNCKLRGEGKPKTFDFLGFTHYCRTKSNGIFDIGRKTSRKSIGKSLQAVQTELCKRLHRPMKETILWLKQVVGGFMNYFAIPGNYYAVRSFRHQVIIRWMRILRRRSHKHNLKWAFYSKWIQRELPVMRIVHPYPDRRFYANTRSRSRVR